MEHDAKVGRASAEWLPWRICFSPDQVWQQRERGSKKRRENLHLIDARIYSATGIILWRLDELCIQCFSGPLYVLTAGDQETFSDRGRPVISVRKYRVTIQCIDGISIYILTCCTYMQYMYVHVPAPYRSTIVSTTCISTCCLLSAVSRPSALQLLQIYSSLHSLLPAPSTRGVLGPFPTFCTKGKRVHSLTRSGQGTEEMGRQKE